MSEHDCNKSTEIALINVKMNSMDEKVDKILASLEGNGKPGMKTKIEVIMQTLLIHRWLIGLNLTGMLGLGYMGIRNTLGG